MIKRSICDDNNVIYIWSEDAYEMIMMSAIS